MKNYGISYYIKGEYGYDKNHVGNLTEAEGEKMMNEMKADGEGGEFWYSDENNTVHEIRSWN